MKKIDWVKLIAAVGICEGVGLLAAVFTAPAIKTWYPTINKPTFNPPNYLFGPVWTTLFALMGIALYLVWQVKNSKKKAEALQIFWLQLGLNVLWSVLFFGLHSPLLALVEIIILWLAIAMTIKKFKRVSPTAGWLLVPYLIWVSFASILNLAIVQLN